VTGKKTPGQEKSIRYLIHRGAVRGIDGLGYTGIHTALLKRRLNPDMLFQCYVHSRHEKFREILEALYTLFRYILPYHGGHHGKLIINARLGVPERKMGLDSAGTVRDNTQCPRGGNARKSAVPVSFVYPLRNPFLFSEFHRNFHCALIDHLHDGFGQVDTPI